MYSSSKVTAMFVVMVVTIALTLAAVQFFNPEASESRESSDKIATNANFELAEKFSDSAIHRALYGAPSGGREGDAGLTAGGQVIKFEPILVEPHWIDNSSDFWYAIQKAGRYQYYIVRAEQGLKEALFDASTLSQAVLEVTGEQVDFAGNVPETLSVSGDLIRLETAEFLIQYDRSTGEISHQAREQAVQYPAYEFSVSPTGEYVVYAREHNLYVRVRGGEDFQLTDDGEPWYGYSKQFGSRDSQVPLRHRLGWIGDSGKFFVERWDNRDVGEMWFIDSVAEPRPTLHTTRFAIPGEQNVPVQELWIFDAVQRTGFRVDTRKWPGQFLGMMDIGTLGFRVSQDEKYLYFGRMSRGFHEVDLLKVDVDNGDVEVLITEKSEPYFTIRMPMFIPLEGTDEVIWLSDRTGRNHYYLYDGDGSVRPITAGDYTVRRPAYFDSEQRFLVAEVFGKDPDAYLFHRQYYRFPLDGGEPIQLTPEDATHEPWFAPDGRFFVDNYSRADQAPRAVLRNLSGELVMELEEQDAGPLRAMGFQMQEYFTAKAVDGETDLFGVLWKPADFDPTRSYPVIAAVQPNASISAADVARFRPGNVAVQLSQLGFVVVELKTRGQGRHVRDKQFILHSYQNDRDYPLADAKAVIEQLTARHSYLDASRVGAYGHSGGGFMSAALCMKYPALFKVCVSSSGNHDNRIAEQNSTEFHWGVTQANGKDGVDWLVNLHPNQELAEGLDGHLLIIHGDNDTDTHFSQSVRLADALIKAGKQFDFMIMPSQDHAYRGVYNEYFDRLRWVYFAEHLMGDTRNLVDLKNL